MLHELDGRDVQTGLMHDAVWPGGAVLLGWVVPGRRNSASDKIISKTADMLLGYPHCHGGGLQRSRSHQRCPGDGGLGAQKGEQ
jgi:hypothetical protein